MSLHFIHSSFSPHLQAPIELVHESSPAIQFTMDIKSFLDARSLELVHGGLMTLILPGIPDWIPCSQTDFLTWNDFLEASLKNLTKEGLASEAKSDSFNLPMYGQLCKSSRP